MNNNDGFVMRVDETEGSSCNLLRLPATMRISKWKSSEVSMVRGDSKKGKTMSGSAPTAGTRTSYASNRGAQNSSVSEKPPLRTEIITRDKQQWNFNSRQLGASEAMDYWIVQKVGEELHLTKVDVSYELRPTVAHAILDPEEAEKYFQARDKLHNPYALKAKLKREEELPAVLDEKADGDDRDDEDEVPPKKRKRPDQHATSSVGDEDDEEDG